MSNEQWAKETAEILGYWFDCECTYYLDTSDGNGDYIFQLSKIPKSYGGYFLNPLGNIDNIVNGAIYLYGYFCANIEMLNKK